MHPKGDTNLGAAKIAKLIDMKSDEISMAWLKALGQRWGEKATQKLRFFQKGNRDLLHTLLKLLSDKGGIEEQDLSPLLHRVRMEHYSIFDFFMEASCLEDSIEDTVRRSREITNGELLDNMRLIRKNLRSILEKVLKDTSEIYEYIAESGGRAFCQVDAKGVIIYANKEMKGLVGLESLTGKHLASFFGDQDERFVQNILSGKLSEEAGIRQLQLTATARPPKPVGVEIARVVIDGEYRGGYACMVDLSPRTRTDKEVFDKSPLGIVKVNVRERITYANPKALEIFGIDRWEDKSLKEIFPDDDTYAIVRSQFKKRKLGLSDEYETTITRPNDGRKIPIKISAMPETDLKGHFTGSFAIVQSMLLERTIEAIHEHIGTKRDAQQMLSAIAKEVEQVMPYALFTVSLYTPAMTHVCQLFSYYPEGQLEWQVRWWKIPDFLRDWLRKKEIIIIDSLEKLFVYSEWQRLRNMPDIKTFLKEGFRSSIRYPILKEDMVVASVALYGKAEKAFDKNHKNLLKALPLGKAVVMALYYEETKDLKFLLDLMRDISSSANNIQQVADTIVNRLAVHFKWPSVALFRVDEGRGKICLLSQKASSKEFRFPHDFEQSVDEGVLGYSYRKNEPITIGDVHTDAKFRDVYKATLADTLSQLCLPIKAGEVSWLLNIEDRRRNAFSEQEEAALNRVVNELAAFLEKAWLHHFLSASLHHATDAVIVTDMKGHIKNVNPATTTLLHTSEEQIKGRPLKNYFKRVDVADRLLEGKIQSTEVILRRGSQGEVPVIFSTSKLEHHFTDKVFFATDLSVHKRLEELKHLDRMYYELGTQTKTPLSLAFSWLDRLKRETKNDNLRETLDKTLRQLTKVELSYDRLALYDERHGIIPYNELLLDISEFLNTVLDEFPASERDMIDIEGGDSSHYLRGDLFQLSFCFATILSYLVRFVPEKRKISVKISSHSALVKIQINGFVPDPTKQPSFDIVTSRLSSKVVAQMALNEKLISAFIRTHNGVFHPPKREGEKIEFRIDLPIAKGY